MLEFVLTETVLLDTEEENQSNKEPEVRREKRNNEKMQSIITQVFTPSLFQQFAYKK